MPIRVVVNTHVAESAVPEMIAYWNEKSRLCEAEEGNLQYEVFRSLSRPENFALLELWQDQATYDRHWAAELTRPKPTPEKGERRHGRDGVEFYFEHCYYRHENGIWRVSEDQL